MSEERREEEYDYPDRDQEKWWEYDDGGFIEWEDSIVRSFIR